MTKRSSGRLHRRTLLTGSAVLGASAIVACGTGGIGMGQQMIAPFEQNTVKRRGVGLRGLNEGRAFPGFTLFAPLTWENRSVYLIDLHGNVVHTWNMPYPPGLSGYLTERGTLFYNGRTSEDSFLSRFPFKGGVVLEADWNGKVLWEVRHPDHHHHGVLQRTTGISYGISAAAEEPDAARTLVGFLAAPTARDAIEHAGRSPAELHLANHLRGRAALRRPPRWQHAGAAI